MNKQVSIGQVKHLPYERLEETIRYEEYEISKSLASVDRYVVTCNTQSIRSTGLRLAVVYSKLSNVKQDTGWSSSGSVQSLQCNAQHSLDVAAPADTYLVRQDNYKYRGHPPEGYRSLI
jgi:hypothetical protein